MLSKTSRSPEHGEIWHWHTVNHLPGALIVGFSSRWAVAPTRRGCAKPRRRTAPIAVVPGRAKAKTSPARASSDTTPEKPSRQPSISLHHPQEAWRHYVLHAPNPGTQAPARRHRGLLQKLQVLVRADRVWPGVSIAPTPRFTSGSGGDQGLQDFFPHTTAERVDAYFRPSGGRRGPACSPNSPRRRRPKAPPAAPEQPDQPRDGRPDPALRRGPPLPLRRRRPPSAPGPGQVAAARDNVRSTANLYGYTVRGKPASLATPAATRRGLVVNDREPAREKRRWLRHRRTPASADGRR